MLASLDASPRLGRSCRVLTMIAVAITAVAAAILYVPILTRLTAQWIADEDAAYGGIVAGAAALLFVQRWSRVRALSARGSNAGAMLLVGGCLIYAIGTLAADVFLVRLSLPVFLLATMLFVAGRQYVRVLAAPLALCFVAIPLPSALVTEITMPLQLMASHVAATLLGGIGVTVVRDGNVLTLSYITLEVAQACNGMRSLVTLGALVAVYAAMRELPPQRLAFLAAITVPVALVGNGIRLAITALLAAPLGVAATRGAVHDATGWFAFVLMALAIYGSELLLNHFTPTSPVPFHAEYEPVRSHAAVGSE